MQRNYELRKTINIAKNKILSTKFRSVVRHEIVALRSSFCTMRMLLNCVGFSVVTRFCLYSIYSIVQFTVTSYAEHNKELRRYKVMRITYKM